MKKLLQKSKIDWCDVTWNPIWGCLNHCPYCYAKRIAKRWGKAVCGRDDFVPTWVESNFRKQFPGKPSVILVNSMSDFEHWDLPWIKKVIDKIADHPEHIFMFLTKRPAAYTVINFGFPGNVWLGATATSELTVGPALTDLSAAKALYGVHVFLSIEPLHGHISKESVDKDYLDWIIVGAETGSRKGKVLPDEGWIEEFLQCETPVFFKDNIRGYYRFRLPRMWPQAIIQHLYNRQGEEACRTLLD
jgi:protein gp37